jgi:nucleoside-diphosphate-sugar epimerase
MAMEAGVVSDDIRIRPEMSEVERLVGSNKKIRQMTDWKPSFSLENGIAETIKWFSDNQNLRHYKYSIYNV